MGRPNRGPLPNKGQILMIADLSALGQLKDDIDRAAEIIATDLEFGAGGKDWATRARQSLAHHRYVSGVIGRRIGRLKAKAPRLAPARPDSECHALTLEALLAPPSFNAAAMSTTNQIDTAAAKVRAVVEAIEDDRADEVSLPIQKQDSAFLAKTKAALAKVKARGAELQLRRGEISRAEKNARHAEHQYRREQMFMTVARDILPEGSFAAILAEVDARMEAGPRDGVLAGAGAEGHHPT